MANRPSYTHYSALHYFSAGFLVASFVFSLSMIFPSARLTGYGTGYDSYYQTTIDSDHDGISDAYDVSRGVVSSAAATIAGACNDGVDNDADGALDLMDRENGIDCDRVSSRDGSSSRGADACTDGIDNDADGMMDLMDRDNGNKCDSARAQSSTTPKY